MLRGGRSCWVTWPTMIAPCAGSVGRGREELSSPGSLLAGRHRAVDHGAGCARDRPFPSVTATTAASAAIPAPPPSAQLCGGRAPRPELLAGRPSRRPGLCRGGWDRAGHGRVGAPGRPRGAGRLWPMPTGWPGPPGCAWWCSASAALAPPNAQPARRPSGGWPAPGGAGAVRRRSVGAARGHRWWRVVAVGGDGGGMDPGRHRYPGDSGWLETVNQHPSQHRRQAASQG
jgi:hypothetical protein